MKKRIEGPITGMPVFLREDDDERLATVADVLRAATLTSPAKIRFPGGSATLQRAEAVTVELAREIIKALEAHHGERRRPDPAPPRDGGTE